MLWSNSQGMRLDSYQSSLFVCLVDSSKIWHEAITHPGTTGTEYRYPLWFTLEVVKGLCENMLAFFNNDKQKLLGITDGQSDIEYMFVISTVLADGFERRVWISMEWHDIIQSI